MGSPKFFLELFTQLNGSEKPWKDEHVQGYFYNRIIGSSTIFDGCMPLAQSIGAVTVDTEGHISLNPSLIPALVNANFLRLLLDFNLLHPHPDKHIKKYVINAKYKKFFDKEILPEINRRKLGIEELKLLLERNSLYGEEAEKFVLSYERKRLVAHPHLSNVGIISTYDVAAGYDIASYESITSTEIDRFIEVKSFSSSPSFHWSRNEIDVARLRRAKYFLYFVDRNGMQDLNYEPMMIRDPYVNVMN